MRLRITSVERYGLLQQCSRSCNVRSCSAVDEEQGADDALPGIEAFRRLTLCADAFSGVELRLNGSHNLFSDCVLYREDVAELLVVPFGPNVVAGHGIKELGGYTRAGTDFAHAAFKDIAHPKLARHPFDVDLLTPVGECRIA